MNTNLDKDNIIEYIPISAFDLDKVSRKEVIINNNYKMLKNIVQWFVYSSANPQAVSLTVKGLIPLLLILGIDSQDSEALADNVSQFIIGLGLGSSALLTLFGLVRKILKSLKLS